MSTIIASDDPASAARAVLAGVMDPEIPVLSVLDLGIVRRVEPVAGIVEVDITPTWTGCPAGEVILAAVRDALAAHGIPARVTQVLTPAWSPAEISPQGHERLRTAGIAPPTPRVSCPRCSSTDVRRVSEFGATPCKAHYTCRACLEPFDAFKCL